MKINNFNIQNTRNIRLASCDALPQITIITGPNGCGKSTLLDAIRRSCGQPVLYLGPHRSSRRQTVRMRYLMQSPIAMSTLLSSGSLPGIEGLNIPTNERDPWNFDEAGSYLKFSLCQVELDRQAALTKRFDREGRLLKEEVSNVWQPLETLTSSLLPHMKFHHIDVTNRDAVRCLFQVHSKDILIDIDELSSGEKSIIQLFYPLIEHQVKRHIATIESAQEVDTASSEIAILIDEPELHLHPLLQGKILDYMRKASAKDGVQFILATHSPTIVEEAGNEELFLLRPSELVEPTENQFVQIATTQERLELMRDLFGSTSNITALRPILVVESVPANVGSRSISDARVYAFLSERFGQINIISGGGKSEAKMLAKRLTEFLKPFAASLVATALLDRDTEETSSSSDIIYLPVSMIENFLVDPQIIWDAIATVRHKTDLQTPEEIAAVIDQILSNIEEHEVSRRVKARFGVHFFRLSDPISDAANQIAAFVASIQAIFASTKITEETRAARTAIEALKNTRRRREHFDGKLILNEFFKLKLHATGMSKEIFLYECARQASRRNSVKNFVSELFKILEGARARCC